MHIEPGIVTGAKMILSYGTAAAAGTYTAKLVWDHIKAMDVARLAIGTAASTVLTFIFFQVLPHFPVGVSEVHFILGSTLFLLFGAAPAGIGLALGLLAQGVFFAPFDLPQYTINVTTLLAPLYAMSLLARRIIPAGTRYADVSYGQALALSTAFQAGVVAWVAFWAFYGQGFSATTLASVTSFGAAYMMVILIEPLADLAVLAGAKTLRDTSLARLFTPRLFAA
ncbi:cobalt transporter [Primorskyibacter flagellatus]|uniref:Cobalt transporter n=1 Tax=Primorskyibacter flagellatus TaxID=1387277 RepID=A0A917AC26_9RHOB|nr:energy-coupling factor ABC transporter permease [Primorskyibacter flagellatus]GGE41720.1 cobalt transporter [Primorskyibacter flagellatus]